MVQQWFIQDSRKCLYLLISVVFAVLNFACHNKLSEQTLAEEYCNTLKARLKKAGIQVLEFPDVEYDSLISANAQLRSDTIRVGKSFFANHYFTYEDRLSILYHEFNHNILKRSDLFPCKTDKYDKIVQFRTSHFFLKPASPLDSIVVRDELLQGVENEQIKMQIEEMTRKDELCRFVYAPSNLSREEINCYNAEISGADSLKLFSHSELYRKLILHQIKLESLYMKMRLEFEQQNGLLPSGETKQTISDD